MLGADAAVVWFALVWFALDCAASAAGCWLLAEMGNKGLLSGSSKVGRGQLLKR